MAEFTFKRLFLWSTCLLVTFGFLDSFAVEGSQRHSHSHPQVNIHDPHWRRHHHKNHEDHSLENVHKKKFSDEIGLGRMYKRQGRLAESVTTAPDDGGAGGMDMVEDLVAGVATDTIVDLASKVYKKGKKYGTKLATKAYDYGKDKAYDLGSKALDKAYEYKDVAYEKGMAAVGGLMEGAKNLAPAALEKASSLAGQAYEAASPHISKALEKGYEYAKDLGAKGLSTAMSYAATPLSIVAKTGLGLVNKFYSWANSDDDDDDPPAAATPTGRRYYP